MAQAPAAAMGDRIVGVDTHTVLVPSPGGPVETPMPFPFSGTLADGCCQTVLIGGRPAATVGSTACNTPPHIPPIGTFKAPPQNKGSVSRGSSTVFIGGKAAARSGDPATTCNDPAVQHTASVVAASRVFIGS
ncbi:PAAR domain-containing protein [Streptomyces sp. NEAU-Y11]|uniref:PAAR domain-containing protein n=1 Tax=Streptomyces cucumeris TaxID=2962890 RepID=UPI0020C8C6AA|nr:PAAR domain-containing protein [Streptomyces sp. NEAU-Y11]MCP9213154.1 PAAR domain-containing protein [Streptomyces sp. NEAU-Y11]